MSTDDTINLPPRPSEVAMAQVMRELDPDRPNRRRTDPTGGPGHPFEYGQITISLRWDGGSVLSTLKADVPGGSMVAVPHHLTDHDRDRLESHFREIRGIVYRAQWRAAQPPEQDDDAEATD